MESVVFLGLDVPRVHGGLDEGCGDSGNMDLGSPWVGIGLYR